MLRSLACRWAARRRGRRRPPSGRGAARLGRLRDRARGPALRSACRREAGPGAAAPVPCATGNRSGVADCSSRARSVRRSPRARPPVALPPRGGARRRWSVPVFHGEQVRRGGVPIPASLDAARARGTWPHRVCDDVRAVNCLFRPGCRGPPAPRPPAKGPAGPLGSPAKGGRRAGFARRMAAPRASPQWPPFGNPPGPGAARCSGSR
ncbi:MAG: hypothetical protein RL071_530 [Pseudomonadota bacterium]